MLGEVSRVTLVSVTLTVVLCGPVVACETCESCRRLLVRYVFERCVSKVSVCVRVVSVWCADVVTDILSDESMCLSI